MTEHAHSNAPFRSLEAAKRYVELVWRRTEKELADEQSGAGAALKRRPRRRGKRRAR